MSVSQHSSDDIEATEDDASIVARAAEGDSGAFDTLVRRHSSRLLRMTFALVGNQQDAEDLMQEAFAKAYFKIQSFSGRSSFFTWLYRITVNQSISNRRKRRLESTHQGLYLDDAPAPTAEEPSAEAVLETHEEVTRVRRAIAQLDDDRRTVLVLRDIEGLDYKEIAEVLEIPRGTVRSRLHRARSDLHAILEKTSPCDASTDRPALPFSPRTTQGES